MALRLHQVHPSLVHLPIALLPLTVAADGTARVTGDSRLSWLARRGMVVSAASGLVAGVAGLIAQEEVNIAGDAMDTLIAHRNLNLAAVALTYEHGVGVEPADGLWNGGGPALTTSNAPAV